MGLKQLTTDFKCCQCLALISFVALDVLLDTRWSLWNSQLIFFLCVLGGEHLLLLGLNSQPSQWELSFFSHWVVRILCVLNAAPPHLLFDQMQKQQTFLLSHNNMVSVFFFLKTVWMFILISLVLLWELSLSYIPRKQTCWGQFLLLHESVRIFVELFPKR